MKTLMAQFYYFFSWLSIGFYLIIYSIVMKDLSQGFVRVRLHQNNSTAELISGIGFSSPIWEI